jgi:hypothetical protein
VGGEDTYVVEFGEEELFVFEAEGGGGGKGGEAVGELFEGLEGELVLYSSLYYLSD